MPKRFLVLDLATGAVDAAITAAVQAAIAATAEAKIIKITVADQPSRFALTTAQVQTGDYVFQTDTVTLYEVIDQTQLNGASGYVALATVTAAQISDASAAGRALLTGNVSIGSGADAVTLQTSGATLLQLPAIPFRASFTKAAACALSITSAANASRVILNASKSAHTIFMRPRHTKSATASS
jgi:hypothetical protein